ncbi:hypothetical protein HNY73_011043 [Argiope bruennichi]|uniref:DUF5641 domain-containing protein n=1 Tax=Argiope bruennichi TaxID=94029 RepID=A0A8T0F7Y4_ARGBR|nr:hypothetical protein HNY73_011043 [Argiope bruennichi]
MYLTGKSFELDSGLTVIETRRGNTVIGVQDEVCHIDRNVMTTLAMFRLYLIGLSADIEKAFLILSVDPTDRDYLRFIFPSKEGESMYRQCRIVFGLNSSPFLLSGSIKHLLDNDPPEYSDVVEKSKCSFYVDNCLSGVYNVDEEENFIDTARQIMSKDCFNLRGWQSFRKKLRFRRKLIQDFRSRFEKENLGQLRQKRPGTADYDFKVGDIVIIEEPSKKRVFWSLEKVISLFPGRDGKVHTLKLKYKNSELIRPIQRVCPLEVPFVNYDEIVKFDGVATSSINKDNETLNSHEIIKNKVTRSSRLVKKPERLGLFNEVIHAFE